MVLEEWVPLEAQDVAVVPIAEVRWEVVVAEKVALLRLLVWNLHLRIVYSCLGMFLVVRALWCRRRW